MEAHGASEVQQGGAAGMHDLDWAGYHNLVIGLFLEYSVSLS